MVLRRKVPLWVQLGGGWRSGAAAQRRRRRPPNLEQRGCGGICVSVQPQNFRDPLGLQRGECVTQRSKSALQVGRHARWAVIESINLLKDVNACKRRVLAGLCLDDCMFGAAALVQRAQRSMPPGEMVVQQTLRAVPNT